MPKKNDLQRALAAFPFTKLKPLSFAVEIAALSQPELEKHPVRVWVELDDIARVVEIAGFARVLRVYEHLNFVYLETEASQLKSIVKNDAVRSVWNDLLVRAEGCVVVTQPHPSAAIVAGRPYRLPC